MTEVNDVIETADAKAVIYRNSPAHEGRRTASIGGFACADAVAGERVLREVAARLKADGFGAVLGPMNGNTWAHHRLVVETDGSAPFVMEPSNPDWYPEAFERAGFEVVSRYVSAVRRADAPATAGVAPAGTKVRAFDLLRAEAELAAIHALSLKKFADNAFYTPIPLEAFRASYRPVLPAVDPELVFLVEDEAGELRGFLFAIPNLAEGAKPSSVILKTYASDLKGVGSLLADVFHQRARDKGFDWVIHALMHESNLSATHSDRTGGRVFRRYALWGQVL